jgi:transcriptional regulator with XRE-family HTH domain
MSQSTLAHAIGVTFQQVQKYEVGTNRIGAGRLQDIARILGVAIPFFFEGLPRKKSAAPLLNYVADFLATSEGLELVRFFVRIKGPQVRRSIVHLVEQIADFKQGPDSSNPIHRQGRRGRPVT